MTIIDERLKEFATPTQRKYVDLINQHGSERAACKSIGAHHSMINNAMRRLKAYAAAHGYSPEHDLTHPTAPGQMLRGASTLYRRGEPEPVLQWVKTSADQSQLEAMQRATIEAMAEELPRLAPLPKPAGAIDSLCNVYTLTDVHIGALAWNKETLTGDWDLKIAESVLTGCFEQMVMSSAPAKIGFVNQCGDFEHFDSMQAVTPLHGNLLDADGRFSKLVETSIRVLRRLVDISLMKHEKVVLLVAEGNHDQASSIWLRHMFKALYENEPRVEVIDSELPYYVYQHGKTMLCFHHGHLKKNDELPMLFAAQFPEIWGATTKRYAHTGHRHHVEEKEHGGMKVLQHATLAARDAYAARGGWISERQCIGITYHAKNGEVARVTVTPEMLEDAA
jgi:hypothetical protein